MKEVIINSNYLVVGKDEYKLSRILRISVRELTLKQHLTRCISMAMQLSCVGLVSAYWMPFFSIYLAALLFLFGLFMGVLSFRKYELQATFKAVDETGEQTTTLLKCIKADGFIYLQKSAREISEHINT